MPLTANVSKEPILTDAAPSTNGGKSDIPELQMGDILALRL